MAGPECSILLNAIEAQASMDSWETLNGFVEQEALAHLPDSRKGYKLRLACEEILLQIEDDGPPFDPQLEQERNIDTEAHIANRPIGGLGLFLVQQSVDLAVYQYIDGRNQYRLYVDLPKADS